MIALADVLPALAVVGLKNKEVEVIKKVLIPCLIYTILAAFAGVCLLRVTG
jgi:L-lactate permease